MSNVDNSSNNRNNLLQKLLDKSNYLERGSDVGIINDSTDANISIRNNGDTTIAASEFGQYKISSNGIHTAISVQSNITTNTLDIKADNIAINRHKLNPKLWEFTDFKTYKGKEDYKAVGNLTINGTVLVKAWEPTLEKYVLIRRPIRTPMFSNLLDIPKAPEQSDLDINVGKDLKKYLFNEEKGGE